MNIGIDARMIEHSGIGVTIKQLLNNLSATELNQISLFTPPGWENHFKTGETIAAPYPIHGFKQHLLYPSLIRKHKVSLLHVPHYDVPFFYGKPFVATVHDIIHFLYPEYSSKPFTRVYSRAAIGHTAKHAKKILTVSDNTKKDLEKYFPRSEGKIHVIYPAVDHSFKPLPKDKYLPVLEKYSLNPGYYLYVGNLRASKNTPLLIDAYAQLKKRHPYAPPLVLVGKTFLKNLGTVPEDVFHIETASNAELPALYSAAALFVYPSLYEGFGLPPLEAMACGVPVISSRSASLPEVCGNAAHYVDPNSIGEITDAMWSLVGATSKCDDMRKKGLENVKRFSWKRFASSTWQIYNEALA